MTAEKASALDGLRGVQLPHDPVEFVDGDLWAWYDAEHSLTNRMRTIYARVFPHIFNDKAIKFLGEKRQLAPPAIVFGRGTTVAVIFDPRWRHAEYFLDVYAGVLLR